MSKAKLIITDGKSTIVDDREYPLDYNGAAQALHCGHKIEADDAYYDWEDDSYSENTILYPEDFVGMSVEQIERHLRDYHRYNFRLFSNF